MFRPPRLPALLLLVLPAACAVSVTLPLPGGGTGPWFPAGRERVWVGRDFWANRLQDWRLADGRAECIEGGDAFPLRTLMLLTRSVGPDTGSLELTVRTGSVLPFPPGAGRGFRGFLLGAGGPGVDWRLSAQVHARPGEDGGLLAVADARGRLAFYDNSHPSQGGGWSVSGPLPEDSLPVLAPSFQKTGELPAPGTPLDLRLLVRPFGEWYTLELESRLPDGGPLVCLAVLEHVDPALVDGLLGLVSHLGSPDGGGWWFSDLALAGDKLEEHEERALGPVLGAQYTVSRGVLRLTAQLMPLGSADPGEAILDLREAGARRWREQGRAPVATDSWTAAFTVPELDAERAWEWRVRLVGDSHSFTGSVPAEPLERDEFVIAHFTGHKIYTGGELRWNHRGIWLPHREIVDAVRYQRPDLLFFSGDQVYEGDLDPADTRNEDIQILDYLYRWYRWYLAFGELTRSLPTVTTPDDHDVYHGNIWGAGGRRAAADPDRGLSAQDAGGYKSSPRFVNAVHRTQTSHLPPPAGPVLVGEGYTTWFTDLLYGGVSFAVLSDRQFKSAPALLLPEGRVKNGWFQNPDFDPVTQADVPEAQLLGPEQEAFLARWARDWSGGAWMKVVLSQSPFADVATIPADATSGAVLPGLEVPEPGQQVKGDKLAADCDSNGWPRSARNRAVAELRRCFAVHLAGDQHLASLIQYGIGEPRDAGFAFAAPSLANTWPRRWWPPEPGANREKGMPPWTGDFHDGFGNPVTVWAVANPARSGVEPARLHDRMPGYGITRLNRRTREITFECWPRHVDPAAPGARQYPGWPRTIQQTDNGGVPKGWLPGLEVEGPPDPVVELVREADGEVEYVLRIRGRYFWPMAYGEGPYTLRVLHPFTGQAWERHGLRPAARPRGTLRVAWPGAPGAPEGR